MLLTVTRSNLWNNIQRALNAIKYEDDPSDGVIILIIIVRSKRMSFIINFLSLSLYWYSITLYTVNNVRFIQIDDNNKK